MDYGYGIWEDEERINKKYFNFNLFLNEGLFFTKINADRRDKTEIVSYQKHKIVIHSNTGEYFYEDDTVRTEPELVIDTVSHVTYEINDITKKTINMDLPSYFDTAYLVSFNHKIYILMYLREITPMAPFRPGRSSHYKGFLLDVEKEQLIVFPKMQTTNSLMCLTDYNHDEKLDYIHIDMYYSTVVTFYLLEDDDIKKDKYYINFSYFIGMPWMKEKLLPPTR